jgi:hypothetical protein
MFSSGSVNHAISLSHRLLDRIFASDGGEQTLSNPDVDVLTPDDWRREDGIMISSGFRGASKG